MLTHKYLTTVDTTSLPAARKRELVAALVQRIHAGDVQLSRKHTDLLTALAKVKSKEKIDLTTVEPIVLILAQVVWDAFAKDIKTFYVTTVTHNAVFGLGKL